MEHVLVFLAIFGCSDDLGACTRVERRELEFGSMAACEAGIDAALAGHTDLSFPMLTARCEPAAGEALVAAIDPGQVTGPSQR